MKGLLQQIVINIAAIYFTALFLPGLSVSGGFWSVFTASILITLGFKILRPAINIITLPLNVITFGMFQIISLSFIVFVITLIYPPLAISSFEFPGISFAGVTISPFFVSALLSYIIISGTIYLLNKGFSWLFDL